jgi:hypothetical protein
VNNTGVAAICCHDVAGANVVTGCDGESLDIEGSYNVNWNGGTVSDALIAFAIFGENDNISFSNVVASIRKEGNAFFNNYATVKANTGLVRFTNNTVTGDNTSTATAQFPLGQFNQMEITNCYFTDVVWPASNIGNKFIFEDNKLAYTAAPSLTWCVGLPNPTNGWNNQDVQTKYSIKRNHIINRTGTTLSKIGFNVPTSNVANATFEIDSNEINTDVACVNIVAGGATARQISITNNKMNNTAPLSYTSGTSDGVFWRNNQNISGGDVFGAPTGVTPSSASFTSAGTVPWVTGSTIDNATPDTAAYIGWVYNGTAYKRFGLIA